MANVKITELTAATALAGTDVLPIVDVGADATKKVSVSDLLRNLPDGTASAPALAFADDQNTGVLSPGDNSLAFATSGTQRLVIDSSGNCGIGTSSPASGRKLHVSGTGTSVQIDSSNTSNLIKFTNSAASVGFIGYQSDNLVFYTNNSEQLRIDSSGRVGIGTTSPGTILNIRSDSSDDGILLEKTDGTDIARLFHDATTTDARLDMFSGGSANIQLKANGVSHFSGGNIGIGTSSPASLLNISASSGGATSGLRITRTDSGGGDWRIWSSATVNGEGAGKLIFANSGNRVAIDSSGNVGIGTMSPTAVLHIGGTDPNLIFGSTGNELTYLQRYGNDFYIFNKETAGNLRIGTNNTERMRIDSSGRVKFGTTSDTPHILTSGSGAIFSDGQILQIGRDGVNAIFNRHTSNGEIIRFNRQGSDVGSIDVTTSATSYNTSSDHRLKENVVDLDGAIDRVKQLAPKRFNFIVDADRTVDGFLAHEAQTVVPEAVTGTHNEVDDDGNAVMQGIDQSKLVPLLTAALQEAIAKIETLETKVAALEAQ